jgi:methionyl-tRNA formyltransferase
LVIACGEGALEVVDLQPSGKKVMKAQEWLRGAKVQSSERFE